MVIVSSGLAKAKAFAVNYFDNFTHMAIGSSNSEESLSSTALGIEEARDPIDVATKDLGNGTYEFTARFELSDAVGDTIREAAIFDAASAGNMGFRKVLPIEISKTANIEIEIKMRVTITATNT